MIFLALTNLSNILVQYKYPTLYSISKSTLFVLASIDVNYKSKLQNILKYIVLKISIEE